MAGSGGERERGMLILIISVPVTITVADRHHSCDPEEGRGDTGTAGAAFPSTNLVTPTCCLCHYIYMLRAMGCQRWDGRITASALRSQGSQQPGESIARL